MKAPQERENPKMLDTTNFEKVRIKGSDQGIGIAFKRDHRYSGGFVAGEKAIRELRDLCDAWLECEEESDDA